MAELIREVVVIVEVDTNKKTLRATLRLDNGESFDQFRDRVSDVIREFTERE